MSRTPADGGAEPFFLQAGSGQRFCLYHPPHPAVSHRGALIYVHPFAEELNLSRRMAALQARAFAADGLAVLQIDLLGCGDSSGDFGDANWACWKDDLALAWDWLAHRLPGPIGLWGLRLGALLALEFARESRRQVERLLLWQPVVSGEMFLTQFLRLRMASEMLLGASDKLTGTAEIRNALAAGETVEIAGYALAPALAASIDALKLADLAVPDVPVHWVEIVPEGTLQLPPAAARVAEAWRSQGVDLQTRLVAGERFWALAGSRDCPPLLAAGDVFLV